MQQYIKEFDLPEFKTIAKIFDLGKVERIKPLQGGFRAPKVKMLTSKGSFVIGRYPQGDGILFINLDRRSLEWEINFLEHLHNLSVPQYNRMKNSNEFLFEFQDSLVAVYHFIEGKPPVTIRPVMAYQLGSFLKKFHTRGSTFREPFPEKRRKIYHLTNNIIDHFYNEVRKFGKKRYFSVLDEITDGVRNNHLSGKIKPVIVHADPKKENELFKGTKFQGIVDFGNAYKGPYLIDICKALVGNCVADKKLDLNLTLHLLKGYYGSIEEIQKHRKELQRGLLFAIYSHIFVDIWHRIYDVVPEWYTDMLVREFLPVARWLESNELPI